VQILVFFAILYLLGSHFIHVKSPAGMLFKLPPNTRTFSVGLSLFAGRFTLPYLLLVSSMLLSQGEIGVWFLLSISLGIGWIYYVFIPLWNQMPFENENDFTLMRFPDRWGERLFQFRGYYVGIVVNACLISLSLVAFSDSMQALLGVKKSQSLIFLAVFLGINVFRNTLSNKRYSDGFNLVVLGLILSYGLLISGGNNKGLMEAFPESLQATFGAFPYQKHPLFFHFISYVGLMWWSAQLFDGSGSFAQRIMGMPTKKAQRAYALEVLLEVAGFLVILYLSLQAYKAMGDSYPNDQVLFAWMAETIGSDFGLGMVALLIFILLITTTENNLNWAGSLVDSTQKGIQPRIYRYGYMLGVALLALVFVWFFESIANIIYFFLGISAGTSIIFILRWFSPRINAQVQLASMIGAVVYSFIASQLTGPLGIPLGYEFVFSLSWVTLCNLLTCMLVSWLTFSPQNKADFEAFRAQLIWPKGMVWIKAAITGPMVVAVAYGLYRYFILGF
jgi:hypothetical protein